MTTDLFSEVSQGRQDFDWSDLKESIVARFRTLSPDLPSETSPASTAVAPMDRITTREEIREYLLDSLMTLRSPPVTVQRLCEFLLTVDTENIPENFFYSLERILSPSRCVCRKSFDASPGSSSAYSVSPGRHLNRPFRQNFSRFSL
jgi:hypothetical protein